MSAIGRIRAKIVELATDPASGWVAISGYAICWTDVVPTPDYHRGTGFGQWDQDTYHTHVFVSAVAGKIILGAAHAPWVGRRDSVIPLWLAEAILNNPSLGLDSSRQIDMRNARRGAR